MKPKLLFAFIIFSYIQHLPAQNMAYQTTLQKSRPFLFMENKGQLADENGQALPDIKYYGHQGGVNVYCKPGMVSFVFIKTETNQNISEATGMETNYPLFQDNPSKRLSVLGAGEFDATPSPSKISTSRIDLVLIGSNKKPLVIPSDKQEYSENFYTNQGTSQNAGNAAIEFTNVHSYKTITYTNIYPYIDMILNIRAMGLEYSFLVHPGGIVSDIKMNWKGMKSEEYLENGGIRFSNNFGSINQSALITYSEGKKIQSSFESNRLYTFIKVGEYDHNKDLLIDPDLYWASYFGNGNQQSGNAIATDNKGNIIIAGFTTGSTGFATSGAFQTSFVGIRTTFMAKFSSSCSLLWSTYYGGGSTDGASGVKTDALGNIYLDGTTSSSGGMATSGANQTSNAGNYDAFVSKFNSSGKLVWGTYFGGTSYEFSSGLSIDESGNLYISGFTESTSGIASSGAYQTSYGGNADAYLAKFSNSGSLVWATYFGGPSDDYANAVSTDTFGNVFILGWTTSTKGIATTGAYQTSPQGNYDAFLAKFNSSGTLGWATYYGGKSIDWATGVATDLSGNVFITGYTQSSNGIATAGSYQSGLRGVHDAYLAKFNNSGVLKWATYYGLSADNGLGIATDSSGNVIISGLTTTSNSLATCGAYQTALNTIGPDDAFLAKFSGSGTRLWATYYGGSGLDWGNAVCTDITGNIYMTGMTTSSSGIASSTGYQTSLKGDSDAFLLKFSNLVTDAGIFSLQSPLGSFCPGIQNVKVQIKNYGSFVLDSVQINLSINGKNQKPFIWKGALSPDSIAQTSIGSFNFLPGTNAIKIWTALPNGVKDSFPCNDTLYTSVTTYPLPAPLAGGNHSICSGASVKIGATAISGYTYSWTSKPTGFTSTTSNPNVTPATSTAYYLTETIKATGCSTTDTSIITVNPLPSPNAGGSKTICADSKIVLGGSQTNGHTYSWGSIPAGYSSTLSNPTVSPSDSTIYYVTETITSTGCSNADTAYISVNPLPIALTVKNLSICTGASATLGATSVNGHSYKWTSNPTGLNSSLSNVTIKPTVSTVYYLTETIIATGCIRIDTETVNINPLPKPNAGKDQTICTGKTVSLGYAGTSGDSYQWSRIPSGFSAVTPMVTDNPTVSSTYILTETNQATGCTASDTVKVTISPPPGLPVIIGNALVCISDSPFNYNVKFDTGSRWTWTISLGKIISGQGTNNISVKFDTGSLSGIASVSVTETNAFGCTSGIASRIIKVQTIPDAHFKVLSDSPAYIFKAIDTTENHYAWSFGDGARDSLYKTTHYYIFKKDSMVKVTLIVGAPPGCSSSFDSVIDFHYFQPPSFNIQLYPNPFKNQIQIGIDLIEASNIQISIYDVIGRFIGQLPDVQQPKGKHTYNFDATGYNLANGLYFFVIVVNGSPYVRAVVRD